MSMTITKLAKTAGVGKETVRYYQRRGLMPIPMGQAGAYRTYDKQHVDRLQFIRRAQAAGFTLEEVKQLLKLDPTEGRERVRQLAQEKVAALEAKIVELRASQSALSSLLSSCVATSQGPCPIIEAFAPGH